MQDDNKNSSAQPNEITHQNSIQLKTKPEEDEPLNENDLDFFVQYIENNPDNPLTEKVGQILEFFKTNRLNGVEMNIDNRTKNEMLRELKAEYLKQQEKLQREIEEEERLERLRLEEELKAKEQRQAEIEKLMSSQEAMTSNNEQHEVNVSNPFLESHQNPELEETQRDMRPKVYIMQQGYSMGRRQTTGSKTTNTKTKKNQQKVTSSKIGNQSKILEIKARVKNANKSTRPNLRHILPIYSTKTFQSSNQTDGNESDGWI